MANRRLEAADAGYRRWLARGWRRLDGGAGRAQGAQTQPPRRPGAGGQRAARIGRRPTAAGRSCHAAAAGAPGRGLQAGRGPERRHAAVQDRRRRQSLSPDRRGGGPRLRHRPPGEVLGLQRPRARHGHRGRRRRARAHLRDEPAAGADHGPLARHLSAQRHGRRRRPDAAVHQARRDVQIRVHAPAARHASCTTRTTTR